MILKQEKRLCKKFMKAPVTIERTDQQKYLGFVLSSKGDNMVNINQMKMKNVQQIELFESSKVLF